MKAGFGRDTEYVPEFLRTGPSHTPGGQMAFDLPDHLLDGFWDFWPGRHRAIV